jgi:hypothetical protein
MRSAAASTNLGEARRQRTATDCTVLVEERVCAAMASGRRVRDPALGRHAWRASQGQSEIAIETASAAAERSRRTRPRPLRPALGQTPRRERKYPTAVGDLPAASGRVTGADVARHLEQTAGQLSTIARG